MEQASKNSIFGDELSINLFANGFVSVKGHEDIDR
jgi:hypothetical protein